MRVVYVGGCQLTGYPVGADLAFPRLIAIDLQRSGIRVDSEILQPVAGRHIARFAKTIDEFRPDVIILQFGNVETSLTVRSLARRAFGVRGMRSEGASDPSGYVPRPDSVFRPASGWRRVRVQARTIMHRLWLSRFVAPDEIARQIDRAALAVSASSAAAVYSVDPCHALTG